MGVRGGLRPSGLLSGPPWLEDPPASCRPPTLSHVGDASHLLPVGLCTCLPTISQELFVAGALKANVLIIPDGVQSRQRKLVTIRASLEGDVSLHTKY